MTDSHKHENKLTDSINGGKFSEQLSAWQLLKEDFMMLACYVIKQLPQSKTNAKFNIKKVHFHTNCQNHIFNAPITTFTVFTRAYGLTLL